MRKPLYAINTNLTFTHLLITKMIKIGCKNTKNTNTVVPINCNLRKANKIKDGKL